MINILCSTDTFWCIVRAQKLPQLLKFYRSLKQDCPNILRWEFFETQTWNAPQTAFFKDTLLDWTNQLAEFCLSPVLKYNFHPCWKRREATILFFWALRKVRTIFTILLLKFVNSAVEQRAKHDLTLISQSFSDSSWKEWEKLTRWLCVDRSIRRPTI